MKREFIPALAVLTVALFALLFVAQLPTSNTSGQAAISRTEYTGFSSLDFAPPYDVFNSNVQVMQVSPEEPDSSQSAKLTFDFPTRAKVQMVYEDIHVYNGSAWKQYKLSGQKARFPGYLSQAQTYTLPTSALAVGDNYVAAYFCTDFTTANGVNTYRCGCTSATECGEWNIQRVTVTPAYPPPKLTWIQPAQDAIVSGIVYPTIQVENMTGTINATLNVGNNRIVAVRGPKGMQYNATWDTRTVTNGFLDLTFTVTNGSKQYTTPTALTVQVQNAIPTGCGNGQVNSGEDCDGTNTSNSNYCNTAGFLGGSISCTSTCTFDTATCTGVGGSPSITLDSPSAGSVSGTVPVVASVSGISNNPTVELLTNGNVNITLQYDTATKKFTGNWNTVGSGALSLTARARNTSTTLTSTAVAVTVQNAGAWTCNQANVGQTCPTGWTTASGYNCLGGICAATTTTCDANNVGKTCLSGATSASGYDCLGTGSTCRLTPVNCGNNQQNSGEACDGSWMPLTACSQYQATYVSGTLSCTTTCAYNTSQCVLYQCSATQVGSTCLGSQTPASGYQCTSGTIGTSNKCCANGQAFINGACTFQYCGNGVRDPSEQCEGTQFGSTTCQTLGYTGGNPTCVAAGQPAQCTIQTGTCTGSNPQLTITKTGTGATAGVVASISNPTQASQISCGSACNVPFAANTIVTLTETPPQGGTFGGWSGACTGSATTCQVTMNAAKSVTASFNACVPNWSPTTSNTCPANSVTQTDGCGNSRTVSGTLSCSGTTPYCRAASDACVACTTNTQCTTTQVCSGSFTCVADTVPPSGVGTVTTTVSGTTVSLSWTAATDNRNVAGYEWKRGSGAWNTVTTNAASESNVPAGTYTYTVRAKDSAGLTGSNSTATATVASAFVYTVNAPSVTIPQGATATQQIIITKSSGIAQEVIYAHGPIALPQGVTSDAPKNCTPSGTSCTIAITYTANPNAALSGGQYDWTTTSSGTTAQSGKVGITIVAPSFDVSVSKIGTGSGNVTSNPAGIDCGSDCTNPYQGSVTLTAMPNADSVFEGWSNGCAGSSTCVLTSTATPIARFTKFDFSASATDVTLTQGGTATQTVTITKTSTGPPLTVTWAGNLFGVSGVTSDQPKVCMPNPTCTMTINYNAQSSSSVGTTTQQWQAFVPNIGMPDKTGTYTLTVNPVCTCPSPYSQDCAIPVYDSCGNQCNLGMYCPHWAHTCTPQGCMCPDGSYGLAICTNMP